MSGQLYLVSTPIGNMEDLTFRAHRILQGVAFVAAEHPDHTEHLFRHYRIQTPLTSYNNLEKEEKTPVMLERLRRGHHMALVVDEGTPLLADPGYYLVKQALASGIRITPIPGPSSVLTALVASGLPCDAFTFYGSLPKKSVALQHTLGTMAKDMNTSVFLGSRQEILTVLSTGQAMLGIRQVAVGVDLTGEKETFFRGRMSHVLTLLMDAPLHAPMTLIIEGAPRRASYSQGTRKRANEKGHHT